MEIEYKGANCVVIKTKSTVLAVDPYLGAMGLKDQAGKATAQLLTQHRFGVKNPEQLVLDGPGEYEVGGLSVVGVPTQVYSDTPEEGQQATMYRVDSGDVAIAVIGHGIAPLSEEQLEAIGVIDVAILPVGGNGYTLDAHAAVQVVRQLDPKLVIPTHYADSATNYEVEQQQLEPFLKELGVAHENMAKLKIKGAVASDALRVVVLDRVA